MVRVHRPPQLLLLAQNFAYLDIAWNSRKCLSNFADYSNCGSSSGALEFLWKEIVNYPVEDGLG